MAAAAEDFTSWLKAKLQELNIDESVFGSYITGILDSDESHEEKLDNLKDVLSGITVQSDPDQLSNEIIANWSRLKPLTASNSVPISSEDVDIKLAKMLESRCLNAPKQKQYTEEEKKIREAILSQYSQMTDDEDVENEAEAGDAVENRLEKNTNALAVHHAEREKREQAKLESQKKKDKDKEDREKQKQLKEEKKEKRKTQKGERRR